MVKNKLAQVIYQVVFCTLSLIGIISSLGYFDKEFNQDFFLYYTNLSNYICMGFMFVALFVTVRKANKNESGAVNVAPTFNFLCVIMILVTFIVYNVLLAKEYSVAHYFLTIGNLLLHVILPIMFIVHWAVFCEHGKLRWFHPLLCLIMPLIYVVVILIRSLFVSSKNGVLVYPYFFLNVDKLGWGGVIAYIAVLLVIFVAIGYLFYCFDNWQTIRKKLRKQK
ncbi:MAG: Pr6Pr family membrane protein [Clostridia bacterium]|nr:Pr6Pr family membrane protein [Clostridia bacterium]